jgi:hypothetical protein
MVKKGSLEKKEKIFLSDISYSLLLTPIYPISVPPVYIVTGLPETLPPTLVNRHKTIHPGHNRSTGQCKSLFEICSIGWF